MSEPICAFTAYGEAKGAGSKKAFAHKTTGQIIVTDTSGKAGRTWRATLQQAALDALGGVPVTYGGAVEMGIVFVRSRPKSHFGSGRNAGVVKGSAPAFPTTKPDVDKLSRAVLDAMKGIVWKDDSQVVSKTAEKVYGDTDCTHVWIARCDEQLAADLEPGDARLAPAAADPAQGSLLPV